MADVAESDSKSPCGVIIVAYNYSYYAAMQSISII